MSEYTTTITREIEVTIRYTAWPGCRGARDSLGGKAGAGAPLEPDEDPSVEIESCKDATGREWDLDSDEEREIEEAIAADEFDNCGPDREDE